MRIMRRKRKYTDDFRETIKELYKNGKSIQDLQEEYGLPESTVRQWCIYDEKKNINIEGTDITPNEIESIKKEMMKLKQENDILKKALTIFAKN